MLAKAAPESILKSKDWTDWALEPKHDGMRAIVSISEDGVEIFSRTGKSQKGKCPHLEYSLSLLPSGTVLDGEIAIMVNAKKILGKKVPVVDFNKTMRIMGSNADVAVEKQVSLGKPVFIVFDVLKFKGEDVSDLRQEERWEIIDSLSTNWLIHNPRFEENYEEVYQELIGSGVEGAILKNIDDFYDPGTRSHSWLKLKVEKTFDVIVTGYTEGRGKYSGQIGAIEFSAIDSDGYLVYIGRCSGMTDEERKILSDSRETGMVIEVKANEMVGSGEFRTPRHPQFVCIRQDKNPWECLREQFASSQITV